MTTIVRSTSTKIISLNLLIFPLIFLVLPLTVEFLAQGRDRAFSWDITFESNIHELEAAAAASSPESKQIQMVSSISPKHGSRGSLPLKFQKKVRVKQEKNDQLPASNPAKRKRTFSEDIKDAFDDHSLDEMLDTHPIGECSEHTATLTIINNTIPSVAQEQELSQVIFSKCCSSVLRTVTVKTDVGAYGESQSTQYLVSIKVREDGKIGIYSKEERKEIIERFRAKKQRRIWRKTIKYDCRKRLADTRPRVKGRFVSRTERESDEDNDNCVRGMHAYLNIDIGASCSLFGSCDDMDSESSLESVSSGSDY